MSDSDQPRPTLIFSSEDGEARATRYYSQVRPGDLAEAEAGVSADWKEGDVILDLYDVAGILGEGGMGRVYRVHHRGWDVDLAVKSPRPEIFSRAGWKSDFVREAENWVDLGLHPHIVSCHYVRTLGGIPRVFAEYVDGGSLSDWIHRGTLYADGKEKSLERILDIAIQFAWGLDYAHGRGLVHQDVKPANVMMTRDGKAKVTDFGLSRARGAGGEKAQEGTGADVLVSAGGMTPAYCSPEQAQGKPLAPGTDIWSWGLSLLEMFTGEVAWLAGQAAPEALDGYLEECASEKEIPVMPDAIAEMLRECFRPIPRERPESMTVLAERLKLIYGATTGRNYSRPAPQSALLRADGLNNKALSMVDLGREEDARGVLEQALQADRHHVEAVYNRGLLLWRSGRLTDDALIRQLAEAQRHSPRPAQAARCIGLVHLERGDSDSALACFEEVQKQEADDIHTRTLADTARQSLGKFGRCLRVFDWPETNVNAISFSPDGLHAVSGGADKSVRLWDVETGKTEKKLQGHRGEVSAVAFSPDGRFVLSGSHDYTLRLWDIRTGECVRVFEGHRGKIHALAFSPDGRLAVSCCGIGPVGEFDTKVRIWDVASGQTLRILAGHESYVQATAFSPDGRTVLTGSSDCSIRLWDVESGNPLRTFSGHTSYVEAVCFSPAGGSFLSAGAADGAWLWDVATGEIVRRLEGHHGIVNSVAFSSDGRFALSCGGHAGTKADFTVRLWDVMTGRCVRTYEGHEGMVHSVAFSPTGPFALSAGENGPIRLWAIAMGAPQEMCLCRPENATELAERANRVEQLRESANRALGESRFKAAYDAVTQAMAIPGYSISPDLLDLRRQCGKGGTITGLLSTWLAKALTGHTHHINSISFSPDGRLAISGSDDKTARLWEVTTGECRHVLSHRHPVRSVAFSPDGRLALAGAHKLDVASKDTTLFAWDTASGRLMKEFEQESVTGLSFSPDGRVLMCARGGQPVQLWDYAAQKTLPSFDGVVCVQFAAFSPDGKTALLGLQGTKLESTQLWSLESRKMIRAFEGYNGWIYAVAFSPDGGNAIAACFDNSVRIWDVATGKLLCRLSGHERSVRAISSTPDGSYLLSGSEDGTARLWNCKTGDCLYTYGMHKGAVTAAAFSPDGKHMLFGSHDETLQLWEFAWNYDFPAPADWDEAARPYVELFLERQTPRLGTGEKLKLALTFRRSKPAWTEQEFQGLVGQLQSAGYGWLRPDGVRRKLVELTERR